MAAASLLSWERGFEYPDVSTEHTGPLLSSRFLRTEPRPFSAITELHGDVLLQRAKQAGAESMPPVRLRMRSADMLCRRSMEVQWDNAAGERQQWSSWNDGLCGWFEAEKVLPSSVTNVSVQFKVRTVAGAFGINQVDRKDGCAWVKYGDASMLETIRFQPEDPSGTPPIDAVFELAGPATHCYVRRAWNAALPDDRHEAWECWEDTDTRPCGESRPEVLVLADQSAAPLNIDDDLVQYCMNATVRLVVAATALQDVHRQTLEELREMDHRLTSQWVAVNGANTASAGLAVAGAVALCYAAPIALGICVTSAVVGGGASAGDIAADCNHVKKLRHQLCKDVWNTLAVAELEKEWLCARKRVAETIGASPELQEELLDGCREMGVLSAYGIQFGAAITRVLLGGLDEAVATGAAACRTTAAATRAAGYFKMLGVAGAVLSTGIAIHGWTNPKYLQTTVQARINEITTSMVSTQRWLASIHQLECAICRCGISLTDTAGFCEDSFHCFHGRCLELWAAECRTAGKQVACLLCGRGLASSSAPLDEVLTEALRKAE